MTTTRRRTTTTAVTGSLAAVVLVLGACSSGGDTSASGSTASGSSASRAAGPSSSSSSSGSGSSTDRVPAKLQPVSDGELMSYVVNSTPDSISEADAAVRAAGGTVIVDWPQIGVVVAQSSQGRFRQKLLTTTTPGVVASVGATRTVAVKATTYPKVQITGGSAAAPPASTSRDPREGDQWDMAELGTSPSVEGSRSVRVGVLDGGVDSTHPDLKANFDAADSASCIDGGRLDRNPQHWLPTAGGHGTHVAGTIAAARNGVGIAGVAPDVRIASVKVVDDAGLIYPEYAVCGFMWAGQRKLDVTNNSYFVDPWTYWCDDGADQQAAKEAVRRAVEWSVKQGVVSAAAAGNSSYDLADKRTDDESPDDSTTETRTIDKTCLNIPTELDGVVTVASTERGGTKSDFSNFGRGVIDVAAPGGNILSTWPGGGYQLLSGTSMASPHVAGVLALLKSKHPDATPAELVTMVRDQARPHECPAADSCTGSTDDNSYYGQGIVTAAVK